MPPLNLRKRPVVSQHEINRGKAAFDILEEVQQRVRDMGIPEYPQPKNTPTPLGNLEVGKLSNRDIETYYTQYVAYAQYLAPKLAEVESAYKISESNMKHVVATLKVELVKDQVPKAEHDALVKENEIYLQQEIEHLKLFATKEILSAYHSGYVNQAKAMSRVVELRKLEQEQEARGNNMKKAPARSAPQGFLRPR